MAEMTQKDVEHVARLAKLEVSPEEAGDLAAYFGEILSHFQKLQEADLQGIDPFVMDGAEPGPLRKDELEGEDSREAILREAPLREGDYIQVPRIMEEA